MAYFVPYFLSAELQATGLIDTWGKCVVIITIRDTISTTSSRIRKVIVNPKTTNSNMGLIEFIQIYDAEYIFFSYQLFSPSICYLK